MADIPANTIGDNRNAENTYPAAPTFTPDNFTAVKSIVGPASNDPTAPHKADPLNGSIPDHSAAEEPTSVLELAELGGTGTIIVGGILVQADYNPDFSGRNRVKLFDEMRMSEPKIRLGLACVKYPILAARWRIKAGNGDTPDSPRVKFVDQELFQNPNFSFTQFLRQALLYCDYGNMFFEKVFRERRDGKIGWKKFAPRLPKTIWRYTMKDGLTPGISQILPTGGEIEIPLWKLLPFILDLEGANYEGHSLLRYAHKPYFYKNLYQKIDAIAAERQGCGVPIIHVPPQATPADKAKARVIAKNLRVNEYAYVDLPTGFTLEYIDTKAKGLKDMVEQIKLCNRDMLDAFLASFMDLGARSSGTQGMSEDQSDLFYLSEHYIAKTYQEPIQIAIRELVDLNFSNTKPDQYPLLEYAGLGKVDLQKYGQFLQATIGNGAIVPDDNLEIFLRDLAELPESVRITDGDTIETEERKIAPTQEDQLQMQKVQAKFNKKPMLNREQQHEQEIQFKEALEDMQELQLRIQEAIEKKQPVV